jgi:hypothetical protein
MASPHLHKFVLCECSVQGKQMARELHQRIRFTRYPTHLTGTVTPMEKR